ncbi:MAG: ATP-binding protein [Planctomycetota bacterium]
MTQTKHLELTVPPDTSCLSQVRRAVAEIVGHDCFSPIQANLITLAVDEAVANIMEHGYRDRQQQNIEIIMNLDSMRFEVLIRDHGEVFDPRDVPDINMREQVRVGGKGGLGIFLMRRIMDEINYTFKHGVRNELQMIKYIDENVAKIRRLSKSEE